MCGERYLKGNRRGIRVLCVPGGEMGKEVAVLKSNRQRGPLY